MKEVFLNGNGLKIGGEKIDLSLPKSNKKKEQRKQPRWRDGSYLTKGQVFEEEFNEKNDIK